MRTSLIFLFICIGNSLAFASNDIRTAVPSQTSWRIVQVPLSRNQTVAEGTGPISPDLNLPNGKYLLQTSESGLWVNKEDVLFRPAPISLKSLATSAQPYVIELNAAKEGAQADDQIQVKIIDSEGFTVFHKITPDKKFLIPILPPGKYTLYAASAIFVNKELTPPQKWEDANILRSSKYLSSVLEVGNSPNLKITRIEPASPLGRVNYDGRKIAFSWIPVNGARSFQVELQAKEKQRLTQTVFKVEGRNYDETILLGIPTGQYRYKITALDANGDLFPTMFGFGDFNWQAPYLNGLRPRNFISAGTNLGFNSYNSKSESATLPGSQFDSQDFGFFAAREKSQGKDGKEVERADLYANLITFKSKTMLWANLRYGKGTSEIVGNNYRLQKMWQVQYMSVPEVLNNFLAGGLVRSQTQFLGPSYRISASKGQKEFMYEAAINLGLPLLNQPSGLDFQSSVGSYSVQGTVGGKFGLYWPWSIGGELGYTINKFKYRNNRNSDTINADYNMTEFRFFLDYEL